VAVRVVLDSNVWVSALITPRGNSSRIVSAVLTGRIEGVISPPLLAEIGRALSKKWFQKHFGIRTEEARDYLALIRLRLPLLTPLKVSLELRDPDDALVLGTALAGRVSHLVTGDRDLLEDTKLVSWMRERGITVISPAQFVNQD